MRLRLLVCTVGAMAIPGAVCHAQAFGDAAARTALVFTTVGALPPIMTSTLESEPQTGVAVSFRYGYLPSSAGLTSVNNGGATVIFPAGPRSTLSLTGGFYDASCHDCDPGLMLSVAGDTRLGEAPFGTRRERSRIVVGLNGELGYTKPKGASLSTGSLVSARRRNSHQRRLRRPCARRDARRPVRHARVRLRRNSGDGARVHRTSEWNRAGRRRGLERHALHARRRAWFLQPVEHRVAHRRLSVRRDPRRRPSVWSRSNARRPMS